MQNFCTFTIECGARTAFIMELNGFSNIVVVRRTRESTDALRPVKRSGYVNGEMGHRYMPLSNVRKSVHASRHAKNKDKEVHNISNFTSIVTHGSEVHYADGHNCSLKLHGP